MARVREPLVVGKVPVWPGGWRRGEEQRRGAIVLHPMGHEDFDNGGRRQGQENPQEAEDLGADEQRPSTQISATPTVWPTIRGVITKPSSVWTAV